MDKKLLFFDIDGTLLTEDDEHYFVDSARSALLKAKERGHEIFINTGRTSYLLDPALKQVPFDGFICGCGTQILYRGVCLFHRSIPKEQCVAIRDRIRELGSSVHAVFESDDSHYFDMADESHNVARIREMCMEMGPSGVRSIDDPDICFDKYIIFGPKKELIGLKTDFPKFQYIERDFADAEINYEVVPIGYSKATGIDMLCKELGRDLADCYVFGDSANDLPMLQAVPNSIVMGNAPEEVKKLASFVTRDIREDGIAYALEQLGLI